MTETTLFDKLKSGDDMKKHFEHQNTPCTVDNIVFIEVTRNKGYSMSFAAGVSKNKFLYVKNGGMLYVFGSSKREITVSAGEILFIPAGTAYTAYYTEDDSIAVQAQFDLVYGRLPYSLREPMKPNILDAKALMLSLVDRSDTPENLSYYRIYRVYELLWRAASGGNEKSESGRLCPAISDMQSDLSKNRKIEYYATLCAMSESGFRKLFTKETGLSPIEYRNRLRLEEAGRLIATGEYSVEEAANAVGFNNFSFFCRSYKKHFGHTPKNKTTAPYGGCG